MSEEGQEERLCGVRDAKGGIIGLEDHGEESTGVKSVKKGLPGVTRCMSVGNSERSQEEPIIGVDGVISDEEGLPGVTGTMRKGRQVIGVREEEESIDTDERNGAHPPPTVIEGGAHGLHGGGVRGGGVHVQVLDKGVDREKENSIVGIIEGGAHGLHGGGVRGGGVHGRVLDKGVDKEISIVGIKRQHSGTFTLKTKTNINEATSTVRQLVEKYEGWGKEDINDI